MASGAASLGSAGVWVRTSPKVCTMCTPSCLPAPPAHFTQRRSSCKAGADYQARWAGAWGGEGSVPGVLERQGGGRGPAVVAGVAVPGGAGAAVAGAGAGRRVRVGGGTGGGGGHGAAVARLVAFGGAGVVVAGAGGGGWVWAAGGTGARRGLWGEGEVDVGRRWRVWRRRGELERRWWGLGVEVLYGRRPEAEVDMGRRWRSRWRPRERERRERGLGGSWWHPGEREWRECVVDSRWRCGECGHRGRVCRAGGEQERRRLRDPASSLESGQSGAVGGSWGASRGGAWYWGGGGGSSPVVHGSAT